MCYDKNGFILAQKTLLEADKMKFQWPKSKEDMEKITKEQFLRAIFSIPVLPAQNILETIALVIAPILIVEIFKLLKINGDH